MKIFYLFNDLVDLQLVNAGEADPHSENLAPRGGFWPLRNGKFAAPAPDTAVEAAPGACHRRHRGFSFSAAELMQ